MTPAEERFPFRRRCGWCGVVLRGWQLNLCRMCRVAVRWDYPSPPCGHLTRTDEPPDLAAGERRPR